MADASVLEVFGAYLLLVVFMIASGDSEGGSCTVYQIL